MYIPISSSIEGDKRNKSVLVLDFYRNQLLHLFTAEGMVACVISSSLFAKDFVISKSDLIKNSQFLNKLLQLEFVNKPSSSIQEVCISIFLFFIFYYYLFLSFIFYLF